jgi:hypothetical protein
MHPLLRTLDLTAGAGTESSVHDLHPIQQAASARSHGIPILLSLGLTPLLIYGLSMSLISPSSLQAMQRAVDQAGRSVSLLLHEPAAAAAIQPPVRKLVGPQGPGGEGHREGTSTLDPRLAGLPTSALSKPTEAVDPDQLSLAPRAEPVDFSINPALPVQAGGNGLSRGTGRDAGLGKGGLMRPPVPVPVASPDFRLVATHQVVVNHRMAQGEPTNPQPVRVRILIGEDGIPFQATVVSGPEYLHAESLRAARAWRFEPPGAHGLKAPVDLVLTFRPNLLRSR